MLDARFRIPDHGIARAAQAIAPRVALSFHRRAKIIVCNLDPEFEVRLKRNEFFKIAITCDNGSPDCDRATAKLWINHQYTLM